MICGQTQFHTPELGRRYPGLPRNSLLHLCATQLIACPMSLGFEQKCNSGIEAIGPRIVDRSIVGWTQLEVGKSQVPFFAVQLPLFFHTEARSEPRTTFLCLNPKHVSFLSRWSRK